jgi:hypothetical protein
MKFLKQWIKVAVVCGICVAATPAAAQLEYGPWVNTGECKPASPPVGPGRQRVRLPQAPGGSGAKECLWVRQVLDCPRVRDVIRHPGKCTGKVREQREWSIYRPLQ